MLNLDRALIDIAAMRSHIARGTEFRGYGPTTLVLTALLAVLAAGAQAIWLPDAVSNVSSYLALWVATAILSVITIGIEAVTRSRRVHSGLADEMIRQAVEQFLPAAAAGVLLTLVLLRTAPQTLWMLPGLWQIVLSLGVFASCRSLPRPMIAMGVWYMGAGLIGLALASSDKSLSPWAMGIPFGVGQLLAAALLQHVGGSDEEN